MKNSPCLGCPHRTVDCHPICSLYHAWKSEVDAAREREREQKKADGDVMAVSMRRSIAIKKARERHG